MGVTTGGKSWTGSLFRGADGRERAEDPGV